MDWPLQHREADGGQRGYPRGRKADGREAAASTLEQRRNNVAGDLGGEGVGSVVVCACRCGRRVCPGCGKGLGYKARMTMLSKAELFTKPRLITLTADLKGTITGKGFLTPGECYDYVRTQRLLASLMRMVGCKVWVAVLEFQEETEAPHWHVLVDLESCPGGRLDYSKIWRLWRDHWKVGGWKASKQQDVKNRAHAINYITKYLTKFPEGGFPAWVMARHNVRFLFSSKAVGALVNQHVGGTPQYHADDVSFDPEEFEAEDSGLEPIRRHRSNLQAVLSCGGETHLFVREPVNAAAAGSQCDQSAGAVSTQPAAAGGYRYIGTVDVSPEELKEIVLSGVAPVGGLFTCPPDERGRQRVELRFPGYVCWRDLQKWADYWRSLTPGQRAKRLADRGVYRDVESGAWKGNWEREGLGWGKPLDERATGADRFSWSGAESMIDGGCGVS